LKADRVRPSVDIGALASDFVSQGRIAVKSRLTRHLIERLARGEARHESDLLSYLLFDGNFCAALIDLGYADAAGREEQLGRLFSLDVEDEADEIGDEPLAASGAGRKPSD
jgi:NTE family protein